MNSKIASRKIKVNFFLFHMLDIDIRFLKMKKRKNGKCSKYMHYLISQIMKKTTRVSFESLYKIMQSR